MEDPNRLSAGPRLLLMAAAFVVVVAGMQAARSILVPLLLAVFIALLCLPVQRWLHKKGTPNILAAALVVAGLLALGAFLTALVGVSMNTFLQALPNYQQRLDARSAELLQWLTNRGIRVSARELLDALAPSKAMTLAESILMGLNVVFANGVVTLVIVGFILMETPDFDAKLRAVTNKPQSSVAAFQRFTSAAQRYLIVKTLISAATGLGVWLWLTLVGMDNPAIWGLLAFLLNFVPYIGPVLAALPAVLLALAQFGVGSAILVVAGYVIVNTVLGVVLEPRFMGRSLGLSTLVVFLSVLFWGWVLGPIGGVLSAPLTVVVKIALESADSTRWVAILLGARAPIQPGRPNARLIPRIDISAPQETKLDKS